MEENIKKLEKELKYLVKSEIEKEIIKHKEELNQEKIDIKNLANQIYYERGIDINKLNRNIWSNLINDLSKIPEYFKTNDKQVKKKMIIDIIYYLIIILLLKLPFDLVKELGYDYIQILSTNSTIETLWNLAFLILYTIVVISTFIIMLRNFNKKYTK